MIAYVRWRNRRRHSLDAMASAIAVRGVPAAIPPEVLRDCIVTEDLIDGRRVVTLSPRSEQSGVHVIHTHGGAYVYAIQVAHWRVLGMLVRSSGAVFHVPLYPLAPGATVGEVYRFLFHVYRRVQEICGKGSIVLSGDSAGGGLALGQAIHYRNLGLLRPAAVILFSPWLDIAVPERLDRRLERRDPMLSRVTLSRAGLMWAGQTPLDDPLVSPLNDSLRHLPPISVLAGGRDLLIEDAQRLERKVRDVGGTCHVFMWPSGFHVFMAATKTAESREALTLATEILQGSFAVRASP